MPSAESLVPIAAAAALTTAPRGALIQTPAPPPLPLVSYSQIPEEDMEWLWPVKIPLGALTLVAGQPGLGKGLLTADLIARVSRGAAWPDAPENRAPLGKAILFSAEDDQRNTVRRRLSAAGADLEQVLTIDMAPINEQSRIRRQFSLRHDLASLEASLAAMPDCRLVVIDPIAAYLGDVDANRNGDVRALLHPLAELAAAYRVAVVAVTHLNKNTSGNMIQRTLGALSFVAAARAVWGVVRDPEDAQRRVLLPIKINVADDTRGLSFRVPQVEGSRVARVEWETASIAVPSGGEFGAGRRFNLAEQTYRDTESYCTAWLREALIEGPKTRFLIGVEAIGFSSDQLHRASLKLQVIKVKDSFSSGWTWLLPEHAAEWAQKLQLEKAEQERDRKRRRQESAKQQKLLKGNQSVRQSASKATRSKKAMKTTKAARKPR